MATKILVCGATGFIGRNIVERMVRHEGEKVIAVSHNRAEYNFENIEWLQADLRDIDQVKRVLSGVDIVIQAAATTSGSKDIINQPSIHVTDNAVMNSYLLRAAAEAGVKHYIYFSCSIMYPSSETPIKENELNLNDEIENKYFGAAWTKLYIEKMCEFYSRHSNTRFTAIRHSNVYGEYDKFDLERSHVFGATITKVLSNQSGTVSVWGSGEECRDFMYVGDLVSLVRKAIDHQKTNFEIYNASSGEYVSVKELIGRIIDITGRNLKIQFDETKPSIKSSPFMDSSKIERELNWTPATSLDEGIRLTIDWWNQNIGKNVEEQNTLKEGV